MKRIYYILHVLLFCNFALANNQDTVLVSSESNDALLFDDYSITVSFNTLTKEKVYLSRDSSLFSGVVLADLTKTSQNKDEVNKSVFIGNYELGVIQTLVRINFTSDEFPKDQQELLQTAMILANNQSLPDVYKVESCKYSVFRRNYRTNIKSHLSLQIDEFSEDTLSYREVARIDETSITRIIEFYSDIRHECLIEKANNCIINIEGEGIIYLDLKGRVITKGKFLALSKELGTTAITKRYFTDDNEEYFAIFAFVKTRYKKKSSTKSILRKRYKLDKRLKND